MLTKFWNRCTISRSSSSCQSSSWVARAKKSSTLTTFTGVWGGWFVSCSSFAGVSSPCVCQLMTSKGASVSRLEEQAFGSLFELGGDRVGHSGGGSSALLWLYSWCWVKLRTFWPIRIFKATWKCQWFTLSPYSPDFNPIELCGSQLKTFLSQLSPTTTKMVDILIATALDLVHTKHFKNWFTSCCYCNS